MRRASYTGRVAYRDDLEAAQARADALARTVTDLERRNAELEAEVRRRPDSPRPEPEPTALEVRGPSVLQYPTGARAAGVPLFVTGLILTACGGFGGVLVVMFIGIGIAFVGGILTNRW
jgi:hypothetical protein